MPRILYRLGFDWMEEFELEEGYDIGQSHLPDWARSPHAGIVGTWRRTKRRLQWWCIPLTPWLHDA